MPTYQYACTACDERLEAVQSFTDAPLTECPACGGALRKVFSAVGVVFKGSGFYKTDSRSTPKSGSSGDTKTDTRTDTKTEAKPSSGEGKKAAGSSDKGSSSTSTPAAAASTPASKSA